MKKILLIIGAGLFAWIYLRSKEDLPNTTDVIQRMKRLGI